MTYRSENGAACYLKPSSPVIFKRRDFDMNHSVPPGYEQKFADFIRMCTELKSQSVQTVLVQHPQILGDNYDELIESLSQLADAGLALQITSRAPSPARN